MSRKPEMKYVGNGKWVEVIPSNTSSSTPKVTPKTPTVSPKPTPTPVIKTVDNSATNTTSKAEKEYKEGENVLEGTLELSEARPKLKAKQTIRLEGLGKALTGLYFVDKVTHVFSTSSGYTQSIQVSRDGFGDSIKKGPVVTRKPVIKPVVQARTYTVVRGDNLTKIARKYGTTWQKIYNANRALIGGNPNLIFPGQKLNIP